MAFFGRIAREASPSVPRLEAACILGLCNRLRVLTSGLAVAEATGRSFRMLWPVTVACAARFGDLFEAHPAVREADVADLADFPDWSGREVPRRPPSQRSAPGAGCTAQGCTPPPGVVR